MLNWKDLPRFWILMKHGLTQMRKEQGFAGTSELAASLYMAVWGQGLSMTLSYDSDQPLMELRAEQHHKEGGEAVLLQGSIANIVYLATVRQSGYSNRDKPGYCYLAQFSGGLTKIGYTRQLPKYRCEVLEMELIGEMPQVYPEAAEAWYHTRFALYRHPLKAKFDGASEMFELTEAHQDAILGGLVGPPEAR